MIKVAKNAGFCFGVKRATDRLEAILSENQGNIKIYTLGDLIHNPTYLSSLRDRGVQIVQMDQITEIAQNTVNGEKAVLFAMKRAFGGCFYRAASRKSFAFFPLTAVRCAQILRGFILTNTALPFAKKTRWKRWQSYKKTAAPKSVRRSNCFNILLSTRKLVAPDGSQHRSLPAAPLPWAGWSCTWKTRRCGQRLR